MDSIAQPQLREDDKSDSTELVVTYRATAELKPHLRNARTHSKRQIRQIADSIQAFGFTSPILIDKAGTIIAGHGRVMGITPSEPRWAICHLRPRMAYP